MNLVKGEQTYVTGLNEVQLPKELQHAQACPDFVIHVIASMKCSSRRNCNPEVVRTLVVDDSLNEVQLPKELQRGGPAGNRGATWPQ